MIVTDEEVIAAAGVDPRELHALLAAGRPDTIVELSRAFEEAGRTSYEAYQRGVRSHATIAESYTNDGAPVLDATGQNAQADRNLGTAGHDLERAAGLLRNAVSALEGAQQTGERAVTAMQTSLRDLLTRWNRFVLVAAPTGGATAADRDRVVAEGVGIVRTAAGAVRAAIDEYDAGLRRDAAELRGLGYTEDPAALAAHLAEVPDPTVPDGVVDAVERGKQILAGLGVPIGVAAAALALRKGVGLVGKAGALSRFLRYATRSATDPTRAFLDQRLAQRALEQFKTGFPKAGAHAERGALGTALRGLQESRAARLAGKVALPLTVGSGLVDAATGGGYTGARGVATRVFGGAGALGGIALLAGVTGPVGVAVAGGAVLAYGAWSVGNTIYDHRDDIAEGFRAAKDWAGERLSDVGDAVAGGSKKVLSTVSFGLL